MKKLLFVLIAVTLFSCKEESKVEEAVAKIPVEFKVERFDQIFINPNLKIYQKLKRNILSFFLKVIQIQFG